MAVLYVDTNTLLRAAQLHLRRWLGFPAERVLLVADYTPYQKIQMDQVVEIKQGRATRPVVWSDGHSRISTWIHRAVEFRCRTRLALDDAATDYHWLTHPTLGHDQLEEAVIDAFDDWVPLRNGAALLIQPSKYIETGPPTKKERSPGYGDSIVYVEMAYQQRKGQVIHTSNV